MEDITDADYNHAENVSKDLGIQNLRKCHDLYVLSNTLLLVVVLQRWCDKCIEIYKIDTAYFLLAPRIA